MKNTEIEYYAQKVMFENAEDAIIVNDLSNTIVCFNPAAGRMFSLRNSDVYNSQIYKLIPAELHKEQDAVVEDLLGGKSVLHSKTTRLTSEGHSFPVSILFRPIKNSYNEVIGVIQIITDDEAERILEEKLGILTAITENIEDAIISRTLEGYINNWNKGAEKIFGYTEKEILGKPISLLIPSDKLEEEENIIDNILQGKKIESFETTRLTKVGDQVPIFFTVSAIKNKAGEIIGISEIASNVSKKKNDQEKKAILASIVENSQDAIISKTIDGLITSWNKGAEKIFGYKEQEVIGKHISIIIPPERMDEETLIIKNIRAGIKMDHFQTIRLKKNGDSVPISLTVSPVKDDNGNIIGASKVARDITSEKEAEALINVLSKRKDEFIALASHELKTPLTSLNAYLQLLEKRVAQEDKIFMKKIIKQQEKLNTLVNDLFDISKIQSGKMEFNFEKFDISQLLFEVLEPLKEANLDYDFHLDMQKGIIIKGDKIRIEQAITNLLTNAIKYSPLGSRIEIVAATTANQFTFSVKDYGFGIEPDRQQFIFNQFYTGDSIRKNSGLGLGLFITENIIKRHGGKIWVESELEKGSKFIFILPTNY